MFLNCASSIYSSEPLQGQTKGLKGREASYVFPPVHAGVSNKPSVQAGVSNKTIKMGNHLTFK